MNAKHHKGCPDIYPKRVDQNTLHNKVLFLGFGVLAVEMVEHSGS